MKAAVACNRLSAGSGWPLRVDGRTLEMPISGRVHASDGETLRHLALHGAGLARLSLYHVQPDIAAGRLVTVLQDANPGDTEPIHAVYLGKPGRLPSRIRAVLDLLATQVVLPAAAPAPTRASPAARSRARR